jgi:plasmid stabilization system protein ParE
MPSPLVQFHPDAAKETDAAVVWYRERSASAADAFLSELDRAVERISETPETWPKYVGETRRFLLRHFPFSVVYRETSGAIQVIAVAHAKRKPGYWKKRLTQ